MPTKQGVLVYLPMLLQEDANRMLKDTLGLAGPGIIAWVDERDGGRFGTTIDWSNADGCSPLRQQPL